MLPNVPPQTPAGLDVHEELRVSLRWSPGAVQRETLMIAGVEYREDRFGILHQVAESPTQVYDLEYVRRRYDSIPERVREMSCLRAGYLIGALRYLPATVLDIGYGNGDFLATMRALGSCCYGHDISGYPLPEGCAFLEWTGIMARRFDLVTFFDSLEHMPWLGFFESLRADKVAVTAPYFRPECGAAWFEQWRHRRPGEHLHHFTPDSLARMMDSYGYRHICCQSVEDLIRGQLDGQANTFTSVFERK